MLTGEFNGRWDERRDGPPTDRNDGFMGGSGVDARQTQTLCSNNGLRSKEVVKMKNDFALVMLVLFNIRIMKCWVGA